MHDGRWSLDHGQQESLSQEEILKVHGFREQNVVLQVHVLVQVALEFLQLLVGYPVRGAPVPGHGVSVARVADERHPIARRLMFRFHHAGRSG